MCVYLYKKIPNSSPKLYHFTCPQYVRVPVIWHPLFDMVGLFDFSHSNGYVAVFICISPRAGDTDHLFSAYWPFVPVLLWQSFQSFAPFLLGCLIIELWEFYKFFVTYVSILFPQTVVCLFLSCIFWWAENFNINEIKFVNFFFKE